MRWSVIETSKDTVRRKYKVEADSEEEAFAKIKRLEVDADDMEVMDYDPRPIYQIDLIPEVKTALPVQVSCEIEDLIDAIMLKSGHRYEEVEEAMQAVHVYPYSTKTYLCKGDDGTILSHKPNGKDLPWLEKALQAIFADLGINGIYVTTPI